MLRAPNKQRTRIFTRPSQVGGDSREIKVLLDSRRASKIAKAKRKPHKQLTQRADISLSPARLTEQICFMFRGRYQRKDSFTRRTKRKSYALCLFTVIEQ